MNQAFWRPHFCFQMFMLLLNVVSETSFYEGPGAKHIMFTMGDDFTYQVILKWPYKILKILI